MAAWAPEQKSPRILAAENRFPWVDPEWVREVRCEAREVLLQEQEDYDYRAPIGEGEDWTGSVNE